jgi:molybdopterin converting factor small subunit
MIVQVKLFATLRKYMPAGARGDTLAVELPDGATVADLLVRLGIPSEHGRMVVAGGEQVALQATLEDGQDVNLFPQLAGGA